MARSDSVSTSQLTKKRFIECLDLTTLDEKNRVIEHLASQVITLENKLRETEKSIDNEVMHRQRFEAQLKQSEKQNCLMLNEMICGYALHEIICDENGKPYNYRFIDANPAFEKLTGLKLEEIIGRTALEVLPSIEPHWIEKYGKVALKGQPVRFESYSQDLNKFFDVTTFSPEFGRFIVIFNDISIQKDAERSAKESSEKIKLFAYSISHDLKNPSVALSGISDIFRDKYCHKLDKKGQIYCDMIYRVSKQLVTLVDQINCYVSTKEAPLTLEKFSLNEIMQYIKEEFLEIIIQKTINWHEPSKSVSVYADKLSILRCFRNLVDNAIKYGGNELSSITIEYKESDDFHVLCVKDDGKGVNISDYNTLFGTFKREVNAGEVKGSGLGLAIVKELAGRHEGNAWAEPISPNGSLFCFTISKNLQVKPENLSESEENAGQKDMK